MSYFPDPPGSNITVKLNLENYATKEEVKAATGVDTSSFAKKTELNDVKSEIKNFVSKTNFDNKVNVLIHKNLDNGEIDKRIEDTKKDILGKVQDVSKIIAAVDVSKFATKTKLNEYIKKVDYEANKKSLETKIDQNTALQKANKKDVDELKSNLLKKADHQVDILNLDTKIKANTTQLKANTEKQKTIETQISVNKTAIENLKKGTGTSGTSNPGLVNSVNSNTLAITKAQTDVNNLKTKVSDLETRDQFIEGKIGKITKIPTLVKERVEYLTGRSWFTGNDGNENLLVFNPKSSSVETDANDKVKKWKSTGKLDKYYFEQNKASNAPTFKYDPSSDNFFTFTKNWLVGSMNIQFNNNNKSVYIVYKINSWPQLSGTFTYGICNSLFGKVSLQTNIGRGLAFDRNGFWTHKTGSDARNVIIFGTDNSGSRFQENWKYHWTVLGEGPSEVQKTSQGEPEAMFPLNFTEKGKKFCLSLHYLGAFSVLMVN